MENNDLMPNKHRSNFWKTTVTITFFVFLISIAFANYFIFKRVDEIEKYNKNFFNNIDQNINEQVSTIFDQFSEQLNKRSQKVTKAIKEAAKKKINDSIDKISKNLMDSANATIDLANSKIIRNEKNAEEALKLSNQYVQSDNFENARLYLINAINHDPSNLKYISNLFDLFKEHSSSDYNALREVRSVIELSLYQLDPPDVAKAIGYLSSLNSMEKNILSEQKSLNEKVDWAAEFNKIKEQDLNAISTEPSKIEKRFNGLTSLLSSIQNQNNPKNQQLISSIQTEINTTSNLYNLAIVAEKINNYINLLGSEKDFSSQSASARFLAASSSMSVFWDHDLTELPPKLTNLIQNDIPKTLSMYEKKIQRAKSLSNFENAKKMFTDASINESGNYQEKITRIQKAMESASILSADISYKEFQGELRGLFKKAKDKITDYKRLQYLAYQRWAAEVCLKVLKKIDDIEFFTDNYAQSTFFNSQLPEIDLRLVSPEISQVYSKVFQLIIGELPSSKAFQIHKIVLTYNKKSLEDF